MSDLSPRNSRFVAIGEAAFGREWQRPMARAMNVYQMQVWRWARGLYEIPPERLAQAEEVRRKRIKEIEEAGR